MVEPSVEQLRPRPDAGCGLEVARIAAQDLRRTYADRLQGVLLGSWARGEAHEESDTSTCWWYSTSWQATTSARPGASWTCCTSEVELDAAIEAIPVSQAGYLAVEHPFLRAALGKRG